MQEIHTLMLSSPQRFSPAMSGVALADSTHHKEPAHRRDTSDELDVFEAARYYSGLADAGSFRSGVVSHRATKEERRAVGGGGGERRSVDVPMRGASVLLSKSHKGEKAAAKEKKSKQPISPGGRLASFLNSFFHQGSSKKKSKSMATASTTPSCNDEDAESPAGRRKRRSSTSHCRSTRSSGSSSSSFIYYSSSSGVRTPSLAGKAMKEDLPRNKCSVQAAAAAALPPSEAFHDQGRPSYGELPREKSRRASTNGIFEKGGRFYAKSVLESDAAYCAGLADNRWVLNKDDELPATEKNLWRREEEDGGESDSSSDLFELPNCSLQVHLASGLPVYETTSMESFKIKRGSSSSSVASVALL